MKMGVRGLFRYFKESGDTHYGDYKLSDNYLIIDGTNFVYALYRRAYLPFEYSGEYLHFIHELEAFLDVLKTCHVTPIFVLDGVKTVS